MQLIKPEEPGLRESMVSYWIWSTRIQLLMIVTIAAVAVIIFLLVLSASDREYLAIYFSSNDVADLKTVDKITFSFVVENHSQNDKTVPYNVMVESEIAEQGELEISAGKSTEKEIVLEFKKDSFNQQKVFVEIPDTNQEIFFNAGLKPHTVFVNGLALVEADVMPETVRGDQNFVMNFSWVALKEIDKNYAIFVHFINANYQLAFQYDHYLAVDGNLVETSNWVPDKVMKEKLVSRVPEGVPNGEYRTIVGFYVPGNPRVKTKQNEDFAFIKTITLER